MVSIDQLEDEEIDDAVVQVLENGVLLGDFPEHVVSRDLAVLLALLVTLDPILDIVLALDKELCDGNIELGFAWLATLEVELVHDLSGLIAWQDGANPVILRFLRYWVLA